MVVMISVLVIATLLKDTTRVGYLLDGNWLYMVPVFKRRGILLLGTVYRAGDGAGLRRQTGKIA
ncbi:tyrosine-specific transporter [Klebsiella pneumoniae]|uniref:Tyrosine-specific transporter n=1 Tax=Klebsiella pneumoniae TaxID=573 RepID=A0A2X3IBR1_KLEPN|nr:tyrosine-specific transporter [Klebsiella pneumoniae]